MSRVWLWFDPNSILWVLSIHFRRSLVIKSIIIFLQIHLRKRPKDFCRLHIQFPDSSCLILTLMMQTNLILMTVSKTKETNCISSLVSGNPKRFIKKLVWAASHSVTMFENCSRCRIGAEARVSFILWNGG